MGNFTFTLKHACIWSKRRGANWFYIETGGCHRVLVHYGGQSAVKSGLLDRVLHPAEKAGFPPSHWGGVVPDPAVFQGARGNRSC